MKPVRTHSWNLTPREAFRLQEELAGKVRIRGRLPPIRTIAGVDTGYRDGTARAAVALLAFPSLKILDRRVAEIPVSFPYVPGLLAFRELPAVLQALEDIEADVVMADAHGYSHPRRFGLACHLGVLLERPVLGVAKSLLCGTAGVPGPTKGSTAPLRDRGERIGTVLRTRDRVRPVYVSAGHRIGLEDAVRLVLACCRYRIPEPTRLADRWTRSA